MQSGTGMGRRVILFFITSEVTQILSNSCLWHVHHHVPHTVLCFNRRKGTQHFPSHKILLFWILGKCYHYLTDVLNGEKVFGALQVYCALWWLGGKAPTRFGWVCMISLKQVSGKSRDLLPSHWTHSTLGILIFLQNLRKNYMPS